MFLTTVDVSDLNSYCRKLKQLLYEYFLVSPRLVSCGIEISFYYADG